MNSLSPFDFKKSSEDGFTLTELLVVVGTVAILGLFLLPAIAGTRPNSQVFQCLENLRQLTLGWQMYAEDSNGKLARNCEASQQATTPTDPSIQPGGAWYQWCPGDVSRYSPYSTNFIQTGAIYPYVKTVNAYKCPAEKVVFFNNPSFPRLRSYSMNCWLNPYPGRDAAAIFGGQQSRIFAKNTDLARLGPARTLVFIEENANSIDEGYFAGSPGLSGKWINIPTARHDGAGGLSFADGHAEMKRWTDKVVLNFIARGSTFARDPASGDNAWLQERESYVLP